MPRLVRLALRWLARTLIACIALLLTYTLAMLVLGLAPAHPDWRMPAQGTTVWLTTNGVHAALVLPSQDGETRWNSLFPPANTAAPARSGKHSMMSIGWGDRSFFLNVPDWNKLRPSIAIYALSGMDGTVLHVEYVDPPTPSKDAIPIRLSAEAYARLTAYILASTRTDSSGKAIVIAGHAYGDGDAFYEANGRYTPFTTCNQWVRNALDAAGVRTAWWSPLDVPLFWQLRHATPPVEPDRKADEPAAPQ